MVLSADDTQLRLARLPRQIRHIHLIGVGGSAMTALAAMLVQRGFRVTGSDLKIYEPAASLLKHQQIEVYEGFSADHLTPPPDAVVVGNVVTRNNPEAIALMASAIPYLSMPEALHQFFLRDRHVLMVTGTHGKTTSTALMAHVLNRAGRDPSMLVGGLARDFDTNYRLGAGPDFVIEGDEYDTAFFDKGPKFLHYGAEGAIVTAVEFDHADIYRDLDHVKTSFRALAAQMVAGQVLAVCADFPHALNATNDTTARRLTFGLKHGEFCASSITIRPDGAHFSITHGDRVIAHELHLPVGGRMNVANALGVWVLLKEFGISDADLRLGLATFRGVARRQEIVGEAAGVTVIDDFGHHPTAIAATLQAIAERFPGRRILTAFEPRSNTARRAVFQDEFAAAFDLAAAVYLAPVYFKDNDPIPPAHRLDTARLAAVISARGPRAYACTSVDDIVTRLRADLDAGDIVVSMSNGPFEDLPRRLLTELA